MLLLAFAIGLIFSVIPCTGIFCLSKFIYITEKFITQSIYSLYLKIKKRKTMQQKNTYGAIVKNVYIDFENDFTENEFVYDDKTEMLKPLVDKIKNYISEDNQKILQSNIRNINLQYVRDIKDASGTYYATKNKIKYSAYSISSQYQKESILGHELYHMASGGYDSEIQISNSVCGFKQQFGEFEIGRSINEGYTELITQRTFNTEYAYPKEVKIVKLLELFFDDPKDLENLYFHCNLLGLVKHLENFASSEEIIELILDLDNSYFLQYRYIKGKYNDIISKLIHIKCQLKLYNWFSKKCNDMEKLKKLEEILFEDKFAARLIKKNNIKLYEQQLTENNNMKKR